MTTKRRQRPAAPRLLCSAETVAVVEAALPAQIGITGRMVTKTELVDAIVAVALNHPDEITARLTEPSPEESPDE